MLNMLFIIMHSRFLYDDDFILKFITESLQQGVGIQGEKGEMFYG